MENIEAVNTKVVSVWDVVSGQIEFAVLLKGFEFEKALMQEHFNENYVESDKYPKALFKGVIENSKNIQLTNDNVATVKVNGTLTLHGVTNPVNTSALITVKGGVVAASCNFIITLADYKISIPSLVAEKINKKIAIAVTIAEYQSMSAK
jgi:polyisoprenoid-binding protein YceI